ncbi:MAG: NAD(P)/FAD-dependent oxidoreductase [Bdellovibrionales bacterium]|nr:NAD(P)/FAD-dependent oxidoreductase [Bdellovibrionales bacterium]
MSSKSFDFAIVGSGLPGLILASALSRWTSNIALIDGLDTFGGCHKKIDTPLGPIENGLRFFPKTNSAENALMFMESLLNLKLINTIAETNPSTFDSGEFKKFVGFGDQRVDFYDELSYFLSPEECCLNLPVYEWSQLLMNQFKGQFFSRSIVTKFVAEDSDQVSHVIINGTKNLTAKQFIFCGSFKDLSVLLPSDYLSSKVKSKLNKSIYWTSIGLDLCHKETVTENSFMHVLNGTTQDDIGPCVGRFYSSKELPDKQYSQWITFIDGEFSDDSEVAASALKKMKRQIKRAYPNALDELLLERIFVHANYSGEGLVKLNANQSVPGLENLWIASGTQNPNKNMVGSILQAQLILNGLGFDLSDSPQKDILDQHLDSI